MTSYNQTADLQLASAPFSISTYRRRPLMPVSAEKKFKEGYSVKLTRYDGAIVIWYPSGIAIERLTNGDTTIFLPKPTITSAIRQAPNGFYTHFHKSGAVSCRMGAYTSHWSEDIPTFAENGEIFFDHYCGDELVWDDRCTGRCEYESEYDDPCHYCGAKGASDMFDMFCSRSCMKGYMGDE